MEPRVSEELREDVESSIESSTVWVGEEEAWSARATRRRREAEGRLTKLVEDLAEDEGVEDDGGSFGVLSVAFGLRDAGLSVDGLQAVVKNQASSDLEESLSGDHLERKLKTRSGRETWRKRDEGGKRTTNLEHVDGDQGSGLRIGLPLEGIRSSRVGGESESGEGVHLKKEEEKTRRQRRAETRRDETRKTKGRLTIKLTQRS